MLSKRSGTIYQDPYDRSHGERAASARSLEAVRTLLVAAAAYEVCVSATCLYQLRRYGPIPLLAAVIAAVLAIIGILRTFPKRHQATFLAHLREGAPTDRQISSEDRRLLIARMREEQVAKIESLRASILMLLIAFVVGFWMHFTHE